MRSGRWLSVGLFLVTFATLLVEILDARLLSVLTWYHLSFLAVSLAMLGMAAGAVRVFLAAPDPAAAAAQLPRATLALAGWIVAAHVLILCMPIATLNTFSVMELVSVACVTTVLAVPFYFSGIAVTIALTRLGGSIGRLYAADLTGAALGCLSVVPLLDSSRFNVSSLMLLAAAAAAVGSGCFSRFRGGRRWGSTALASALVALAIVNGSRVGGLEVVYPKNRQFWGAEKTIDAARWNSHSYVMLQHPVQEKVFMWGPGLQTPDLETTQSWMTIDGEAGTTITKWDGNPANLSWVSHDVTALPYHLRRGAAAVIGVGGGRDVLSAIWGGNRPIVAIDVNSAVLQFLTGPRRTFAHIADYPGVRLVHDDARSFLTRTPDRFDVIQMSLIDTWAATGAGAFTLTENGLYTVEAWSMFLHRLNPGGVFSVSRWFSPQNVSETNRLVALGTAALIRNGVRRPLQHLLLLSRGGTATLEVSTAPFTEADDRTVTSLAAREGFVIEVSPWTGGRTKLLGAIARSTTPAELRAATADPIFDYTAPTDERPFFFNMLKPASFTRIYALPHGGVIWGNIRATATLILLLLIAAVMVAAVIVCPLLAGGRPAMPRSAFAAALVYFGSIGLAFMLVQIALLQRFSVYLGHPMYTLSITLFSMILFAGVGSYLSDVVKRRAGRTPAWLPVATAAAILLAMAIVPSVTAHTLRFGLTVRAAVVVAIMAPLSVLLGFFFPIGLTLVARVCPSANAWMWGINGACGVLGSIVAVAVSMWVGISANLVAAAVLYLALLIPLRSLARAGAGAAIAETLAR
ncbi:MAG TPA: hypothetical protein VFX12_11265 [Vicinamibacterales bacterium]|nr:hypothetical protein [Vicinamibacterales bacterium]